MPSSLSIPTDPDCARSFANIATIVERSEEGVGGCSDLDKTVTAEVEVFPPPKSKPVAVAAAAAVTSAAKRKHSSTSSVEKPGTDTTTYARVTQLVDVWR